ncbi:hypothetical protein CEXT_106021 [Caerostris extrusa]|uniref:Uncharacterized protein n=1 Tax=Caerostris extrusa TaxID=172846 RepID=A0AAV4UMP0_CAEEX|nr:hypothetical protein CEXT_106021 [Caerostris extrusa]
MDYAKFKFRYGVAELKPIFFSSPGEYKYHPIPISGHFHESGTLGGILKVGNVDLQLNKVISSLTGQETRQYIGLSLPVQVCVHFEYLLTRNTVAHTLRPFCSRPKGPTGKMVIYRELFEKELKVASPHPGFRLALWDSFFLVRGIFGRLSPYMACRASRVAFAFVARRVPATLWLA